MWLVETSFASLADPMDVVLPLPGGMTLLETWKKLTKKHCVRLCKAL